MSTDLSYTLTVGTKNVALQAMFEKVFVALQLQGGNDGFECDEESSVIKSVQTVTAGESSYLSPEWVMVYGVDANGETEWLNQTINYTINLGGLELDSSGHLILNTPGTYNITYFLNADHSVKAEITIIVKPAA